MHVFILCVDMYMFIYTDMYMCVHTWIRIFFHCQLGQRDGELSPSSSPLDRSSESSRRRPRVQEPRPKFHSPMVATIEGFHCSL